MLPPLPPDSPPGISVAAAPPTWLHEAPAVDALACGWSSRRSSSSSFRLVVPPRILDAGGPALCCRANDAATIPSNANSSCVVAIPAFGGGGRTKVLILCLRRRSRLGGLLRAACALGLPLGPSRRLCCGSQSLQATSAESRYMASCARCFASELAQGLHRSPNSDRALLLFLFSCVSI